MNAAAERARAEAERIANVKAAANAANADVPPVVQAPPVIPPVVPAAALPLAVQVVISSERPTKGLTKIPNSRIFGSLPTPNICCRPNSLSLPNIRPFFLPKTEYFNFWTDKNCLL
jgi:hypothetical protein